MKLSEAQQIAERIKATLAPHCQKCEIAGSIRRGKNQVKDIEIVCIPKMQTPKRRLSSWSNTVFQLGNVRAGKIGIGKFIQIWLPDGIMLDLFVADPDNWGMIYLIRTGSADYSRSILAKFNKLGFHSEGGYPKKGKLKLAFQEEQAVFDYLGMDFVPPENRSI